MRGEWACERETNARDKRARGALIIRRFCLNLVSRASEGQFGGGFGVIHRTLVWSKINRSHAYPLSSNYSNVETLLSTGSDGILQMCSI